MNRKLLIGLLVFLTILFCGCQSNKLRVIRETNDPKVMDVYNESGAPLVIGKYAQKADKKGYVLAYYTIYEYDQEGRETVATVYAPDGSVNSITGTIYDAAGNVLREVTKDANGDLLYRYDYTYDPNGQLLETVRTPSQEQ